jgi:hypothetical protein
MTITDSQRIAARLVGAAYLAAIPLSLFAELYVFSHLLDAGSVTQTAHNIAAHQRLFRLGTASNFLAFAADGVLIVALYLVLSPVHRGLALLGLVWRIIETGLLFAALLYDMQVMKLLGDTPYFASTPPAQLAEQARLALSGHGAAYNFALVLAGMGSSVFALLWWRSGYVPKWLAGLGILASANLAICTFLGIVFPASPLTVNVYGGPIFLFELTMGLWLLFKGLPRPD